MKIKTGQWAGKFSKWRVHIAIIFTSVCISGVLTHFEQQMYISKSVVYLQISGLQRIVYQGPVRGDVRVKNFQAQQKALEETRKRAATYIYLMNSDATRNAISKQLNRELKSTDYWVYLPANNILVVSARAKTPSESDQLSDALVDRLFGLIKKLEGIGFNEKYVIPLYPIKVQPAKTADVPEFPVPWRNLLLGLYLGILLSVLWEKYLRLKKPALNDVALLQNLMGMPCIGLVSRLQGTVGSDSSTSANEHDLLRRQISHIRSSLLHHKNQEPAQLVLMTSLAAGDGTTFVAINLVRSVASLEKKVCYIEIRVPGSDGQVQGSGITSTNLTSLLIETNFDQLTKNLENAENSFFGHLDLHALTSQEMALSSGFQDFLKILRENFDFILLDFPSITTFSDTLVVAAQSDATVIVMNHDQIDREQISNTLRRLHLGGIVPVGFIINHSRVLENEAWNTSEASKHFGNLEKAQAASA